MLPRFLLRPMPIFALQAVFDRIVFHIFKDRPDLFTRMGENAKKSILIDPVDVPFVLVLKPDLKTPELRVHRSADGVQFDASITGDFQSLFRMIDTQLDGDALFFSRDLKIAGDTEAIVSLRNAMDDVEGSIASDVAALHGPPGLVALSYLRHRNRTHGYGAA